MVRFQSIAQIQFTGDGQMLQGFQCVEGTVCNSRNTAGNGQVDKGSAIVECFLADGGNTIAQMKGCQRRAIIEGFIADVSDRIRDANAGQLCIFAPPVVVPESSGCNGGDGGTVDLGGNIGNGNRIISIHNGTGNGVVVDIAAGNGIAGLFANNVQLDTYRGFLAVFGCGGQCGSAGSFAAYENIIGSIAGLADGACTGSQCPCDIRFGCVRGSMRERHHDRFTRTERGLVGVTVKKQRQFIHIADNIDCCAAGDISTVGRTGTDGYRAGGKSGEQAVFIYLGSTGTVFDGPDNLLLSGITGVDIRNHLRRGADFHFVGERCVTADIDSRHFCGRGQNLYRILSKDASVIGRFAADRHSTGGSADDGGGTGTVVGCFDNAAVACAPHQFAGGIGRNQTGSEVQLKTRFNRGGMICLCQSDGTDGEITGVLPCDITVIPIVILDSVIDITNGWNVNRYWEIIIAGIVRVKGCVSDIQIIGCRMAKVDISQRKAVIEGILVDMCYAGGDVNGAQGGAV